jgi:hypothetical protein
MLSAIRDFFPIEGARTALEKPNRFTALMNAEKTRHGGGRRRPWLQPASTVSGLSLDEPWLEGADVSITELQLSLK